MRIRGWCGVLVVGLGLLPLVALAQGDPRSPLPGAVLQKNRPAEDPELRSALYSYKETFPDSLVQDAATYATVARFDEIYPDTYWKGWIEGELSNEDGTLAWKRSREVLGLLTLYAETGQQRYLERAWDYSRRVFEVRDDKKGLADFEGTIHPAWGSGAYGNVKSRRVYLVHTAMILEPVVMTLAYLDGKLTADTGGVPAIASATPAARKAVLDDTIVSLRHFDPSYEKGPRPLEGHYFSISQEEERERVPEPFNRQNVVAWECHLLSRLTGDASYQTRAEELARFFKNRLELTKQDLYLWEYEPLRWEDEQAMKGLKVTVCDDISHAFHAIEPIDHLIRSGVIFDELDRQRFARTLTRSIHQPSGAFFSKIGCGPSFMPRIMENLPGWLCVSGGDPEAYPLLRDFMLKNVRVPSPLFLAYLIRYAP